MLRIGFMGTPDFSVPALKALHESSHEVVCVYSQPPRPKGRGHQVQPSPIHAYAEEQNIPVLTPKSLKNIAEQTEFQSHNLDVAIVVAYGLLLPPAILEAPKHGCINIHASLLPRWRGASPIQQAIWADDKETGVAIMQMDKGLDTGPVIESQSLPITNTTTAQSLHDELSTLGSKMIVEIMDQLEQNGGLPSTPQDDELMTYALLLTKEDGQVNWSQRAGSIDCQVRALNPWPGVWTKVNGQRLKILEAEKIGQEHHEEHGTVLDRDGRIACGENTTLKLIKVQPQNAKAMDFSSAVNGGYITVGEALS